MDSVPILTILAQLVSSAAGQQDDQNSMPYKPGSDGVIWIASGVACAVVFLDLAGRYYTWRRNKRRLVSVRHIATQTTGYDVTDGGNTKIHAEASVELGASVTEEEMLPSGQSAVTVRRQTSRSSSRRSSISRQDGMSRSDSLHQAIMALQNGGGAHAQSESGSGRGIHDVLNDLVEAMRTNVQLATAMKTDTYPASFREKVTRLRSIQDDLDKLSGDVTDQALTLLDQGEADGPAANTDTAENGAKKEQLSAALHRRAFLRSQWLSLRRLLFCVDLQLRHAAIYHVFFEESSELKRILLGIYKQMKLDLQSGNPSMTIADYQEMSEYLSLLQTNIQDLVGRSPYVVPLRMRKTPITDPVPAKAICSLTSDKLEMHDGDSITILDNSNPNVWSVRHASGAQAQLPAVCCVIPPPDKDALLSAARLGKALVAVMGIYSTTAGSWLMDYCKTTLQNILNKKDPMLAHMTSSKQLETLEQLRRLANTMSDLFCTESGYQILNDTVHDLELVVQEANNTNIDDPRIKEELMEPIQTLMMLLGILQGLGEKKREVETVSLSHGLEQYLDDETLDWVTPLLDGTDDVDGLAISVHHQETEVAETSSFTSSTGEVRQTFSIHGVIDPRDNMEISIADAIERGILDPDNGMYIHPIEKNKIPIPVAMNAGLIVVESTETKQMKESVKEVGLVTVNITRETRPYTIKRVRDPVTEEELPVAEAIEMGFFDQHRGVWINPAKNEEIKIKDAIDSGLLIVEYDAEAEQTKPEVTSRTFAIYGVSDRKSGKRLPFYQAAKRGLISKENGEFLDSKSGEKHSVIEAARHGWIKVRVVEDETQLVDVMNRNRSDSLDSVHSTGSFG